MAREGGILIGIIHGGLVLHTETKTKTRKIPQERGIANSKAYFVTRSERFAERSTYLNI
jgi:IMP dehydrogenase/GMP reductase